ncbi:MAG: hypothetical protein RLZZ524_2531 [Pseudomonadota bacterium]
MTDIAKVPARPLYAIAADLDTLISAVVEAGGEITDEQLTQMKEWQAEMAVKAESCVGLMARLEAEAEMAAEAEANARAYRSAREKAADRLRHYLAQCMSSAGAKSIKAGYQTISLIAGRERVVIDDINALPLDLLREEVVVKPQTDAIKERLAAGAVPGAHVERGPDYVQIRSARKKS